MICIKKVLLTSLYLGMSFFVNASEKNLSFKLVPDEGLTLNGLFIIPIPQNTIELKSAIKLTRNGFEQKAMFYRNMDWPKQGVNSYIRGLTVVMNDIVIQESHYQIHWEKSNQEVAKLPQNVLHTSKQIMPLIDAFWLQRTLYAPLHPENSKNIIKWFSDAYIKFGTFITGKKLINNYKTDGGTFSNAAPWLYDRPYTLYQLYLKTGDIKWRINAHKAALFYRDNINEAGYFSLKKHNDLKYLIPNGLLIDYLFYPDPKTYKIIERMYENSLNWKTKYNMSDGFWTERHLSNAISLALVKWELTQDKTAKQRLDDLISGTLETITIDNYGADFMGGCVRHQSSSHEGGDDKTMLCSPWMNALVAEQLWRYHLMTGDEKSKKLIQLFGNQILNGSLYDGWGPHMKGYKVPYYLRYFDDKKKREIDQWTDMQHACDVAAMVAKSAYLNKLEGRVVNQHVDVIKVLMKTCIKTMTRADVVKVWSLSPLRKFNWQFGSTGNLEWLIEQL